VSVVLAQSEPAPNFQHSGPPILDKKLNSSNNGHLCTLQLGTQMICAWHSYSV